VIELSIIVKQLCELSTPPAPVEVINQLLQLLMEVAPSWCEVVTVAGTEYFKLHFSVSLQLVKQAIADAIAPLEE
jgi:hypothetical protein